MKVSPVSNVRQFWAAVAVAMGVMLLAPSPAAALTCVPHPDASPRAVADGTEVLVGEGSFRDRYDGAVFGTVVSMQTQDDEGQPAYGRTEVVIEVTGAYGPQITGQTVVVQDDPGWLNGYGFVVGAHYFIPYVANDKGQYSHTCDPIAEVPPADVPELVQHAEQGAWAPGALAIDGPSPTPTDRALDPPSTSAQGSRTPAVLLGLLVAAAATAWAVRRRGHHS